MLVIKKIVKFSIEYCVDEGSFVLVFECVYVQQMIFQFFKDKFELEDIRVLENVKVFMELFNQCFCILIVNC